MTLTSDWSIFSRTGWKPYRKSFTKRLEKKSEPTTQRSGCHSHLLCTWGVWFWAFLCVNQHCEHCSLPRWPQCIHTLFKNLSLLIPHCTNASLQSPFVIRSDLAHSICKYALTLVLIKIKCPFALKCRRNKMQEPLQFVQVKVVVKKVLGFFEVKDVWCFAVVFSWT